MTGWPAKPSPRCSGWCPEMAENALWYVVHTYSGYENTVAASIMKGAENRQMQDLIQEVNIPEETVVERTDNGEKEVKDYVFNMVPLHMRPNVLAYYRPVLKSTNRLFDAAVAPADLIWFAEADKPVFSGTDAFSGDKEFLLERLKAYEETMAKPYVMGRDLIEAGLEPGEDFSEILAYSHKLRLAGIEKESALKQALTYARKMRKSKGKKGL